MKISPEHAEMAAAIDKALKSQADQIEWIVSNHPTAEADAIAVELAYHLETLLFLRGRPDWAETAALLADDNDASELKQLSQRMGRKEPEACRVMDEARTVAIKHGRLPGAHAADIEEGVETRIGPAGEYWDSVLFCEAMAANYRLAETFPAPVRLFVMGQARRAADIIRDREARKQDAAPVDDRLTGTAD